MSKKKQKKQKDTLAPIQADRRKPERDSVPAGVLWSARESGLMLGLLAAVSIAVFHQYIFLKSVYLFKDIGSDSVNIFYPHLVHFLDYLRNEGLPGWSFSQGMGQNIFPFGSGDIFLPVFYLFGRDKVAFAIAYVEIFKILAGGFFFYLYLRRLELTSFAALTGGVLFGFTGYMILGGGWYSFSYDAMCCAVLLFAFESFFKKGIWWILPIPIALLGAYQPFNLYLYGLFLFLYCTVRYLEERKWDLSGYIGFVSKTAGLALIGVLLSSVFLFEGIAQILDSPRVGGEASYFKTLSSQPVFAHGLPLELSSVALRLFSSDLQGTGSSYKGWQNYLESPLLYCGLITLLAIPQFLVSTDRKRRRLYISLVTVAVIALVFPYARYAFWGFTGNYYRTFSLFISFLFLYLGMRGLSQMDRTSKVHQFTLWATLVAILALLYIPPYTKYTTIDSGLLAFISILLVAYAMFFAFDIGKFKWIALVVVCFEVAYLSNRTVNDRPVISAEEISSRVGFNDYTVDAVSFTRSQDSEFFRIDKNYGSGPAMHQSINDSQVQGYYGSPSYSSFNQMYYIKFLSAVEAIHASNETETRWSLGVLNRPVLQILTSVKYGFSKDPTGYDTPLGYDLVKTINDVRVFKNRLFLPLGFGYDAFVLASDFKKLAVPSKDRVLLRAVVIDDGEQQKYAGLRRLDPAVLPAQVTTAELEADVSRLRTSTLKMTGRGQNLIRGTIDVDAQKLIFFSIPYDKGWSATVDGKPANIEIVDAGMIGLLVEKGRHEIELKFRPRFVAAGAVVSALSLVGYLLAIFIPRFMRRETKSELTAKASELPA